MYKDMAKSIVNVVLEQIVIEVRDDRIFDILANDCTDVEGKGLMRIFIWYVSCLSGEILERAIGTINIDDISSENLIKTVVNILSRDHLNVDQSRVQG